MPHSSRSSGFTLIEMLVAIAIGTILMTLAVPGFQALIANNRLSGQTNELITALNLARSEAIRKGRRVVVCRSDDGASCATSGDWSTGWIIFEDTDADGLLDGGETILGVHQAPGNVVKIKGTAGVAAATWFIPAGRSGATGTLRVCSTSSALGDDKRARDIEITTVGRLSTRVPPGVNGTCPAPT